MATAKTKKTVKTAVKAVSYQTPKYPRVIVSQARHKELAREAAGKKVSIAVLVEQKFGAKKK